ncbi:filamentous hemagglutinin family protein [Luteibacter anthropi]|uniref:filamentous haemagglutinin family protein n=1 Tax=Luteibacter anthropi TaxID=564369 RepID=UPI0020325BF3|nr:filamentous haemagglutinin family protein [Luteibacter anthropi]URX61998.1 filamentous hemagglutinin family protein [Luteibacter anthropi]
MIVRTRTSAESRRPASTAPRPTLRRRAMCHLIAIALFGGGAVHAATPPAFSPAWLATKQPGMTPAPAPATGGQGGVANGNVSFTPGSALLQQRVQQSIQNLDNAAAAVAAQMQAQKSAQSAAQQLVSKVPDGLANGGLVPSAGIGADPSLWQNANMPTDTVAGGKHTVEVKQTDKKAILTWDNFNVGRNTTLYFNQSAGNQSDGKNDWIALNRINDPSAQPSQILGQMKAEGTVYLLNRNGVIFGAGSQVNTRSLIASSLSLFSDDLKTSNQKFMNGGIATVDNNFLSASFTDGGKHDVVIEKGASIQGGAQGFVLIAAPNVSNAGSIIADDGQAILAATTHLGNASTAATLKLYNNTTPQDIKGTLTNTGIVQARRGTIELRGGDIAQSGVVLASTSIAAPGSINIIAGNVQLDVSEDPKAPGQLTMGSGSVTAILPEKDGTTTSSSAAADKAFVNGSISMLGRDVVLNGGSLVEAPGATVSIKAIQPVNATDPSVGRIYIDNGATIDVSGIANVVLPASARLVTIPRIGQNELANSPLLRNSALYTQKNVVVDSTASGTRADGLDWIGSPILNAAGYVENIPRDISQMLTKGGTISLSGSQVIARQGSSLNMDGGYIAYQAGWIDTPNLLGRDGLVYNIADADPNVDYVGFAGQFTSNHARWGVSETFNSPIMSGARRWDNGFIVGSDAGTLNVSAGYALSLEADVSALAFPGERQAANGSQPRGGAFALNEINGLQASRKYMSGIRVQEHSLVLDKLVPGFGADTSWDDVVAADPDANQKILSTDMIADAGFSSVNIGTPAGVLIAQGAALAVQPGGSVSIAAGSIDVAGAILAPAGTIALSTGKPASFDVNNAGSFVPADIVVEDGALLSTRGLWVNDTGLAAAAQQGDRFVNGGSISLSTQQAYLGNDVLGIDGTGNIDVRKGSTLDVSGGGYVDVAGQVRMKNGVAEGRGGDVSLRTYTTPASSTYGVDAAPPKTLTGGHVALDGAILSLGLSGGGTFTLQAPEIRIGGNEGELVGKNGTWMDPAFFAGQGFDSYRLNAVTDATIAPDTRIRVVRDNLIPDLDALRGLPTGGDVYGPGMSSVGQLDAYHRWATRDTRSGHEAGFWLGAGDYLSWNLVPTVPSAGAPSYAGFSGSVSFGHGASIDVDAGATVSLRGTQATLVHGTIRAPAGKIDLGTRTLNTNTPAPKLTTRTWLGGDAVLDASGVALIDPFARSITAQPDGTAAGFVPRTGVILDGGQITLESNSGYVVAEQGAMLDVSGAADAFDRPVGSSRLNGVTTDYARSPVWSNGGVIRMLAAAGLMSDASLRAYGGSSEATGGTLAIVGETVVDNPQRYPMPTSILVQQKGGFVASGADERGQIETGAPSGTLHLAADSLVNSGIADLQLGSSNNATQWLPVTFLGDVTLQTSRSVTLNATAVNALAATSGAATSASFVTGAGHARIEAPYVSMVGRGSSQSSLAGDGVLDVVAGAIDIGGILSLGGWADTSFAASGDLRFIAPSDVAYDNGARRTGVLSTTGNLTFKAAQLYPVTDYRFAVIASAAGTTDAQGNARKTTLSILPNGASQTPLSAGGGLLLDADRIEQAGTVRVPSGQLVLGVSDPAAQAADFGLATGLFTLTPTSSVHLAPGSLTSVSLGNLVVPYGTTIDGTQWRYTGSDVATADLTAPPPKQVTLHGDSLQLDEGATIDLSGGGSLQAGEWVPGTGGSRDVLAQRAAVVEGAAGSGLPQYADGRPIYAILPGKQSPVAAYDAAFAAQGGNGPAVGQQVYLAGVPGLADGYYTLLPARYAELPGAYRVVQDTSAADAVAGRSVRQPDGTYAVSGYFGDALTGGHSAFNSTFLVQSRDVWSQYSQYRFTDADTFFGDKAKKAAQVAPRLAADAGRLVIDAGSHLDLGMQLAGSPGKGGRSSQVDIAAQAIQVLGADGQARDGYLGVSADGLSRLGAGSLLLGGTRSTTGEGDLVTATSDNVVISNDAAHPLAGQEILLVARGSDQAGAGGIVLESGSAIQAVGVANPVGSQPLVFGANPTKDASGNTVPAVSGDGALLRVSQNGAAPVIRHQVTGVDGAAGTAKGMLTIDAGANVQGGSALTLDATGRMRVSEDAILGGNAIDASANRIAFVGTGMDGGDDGLVIGARTLDLFRGASEVTLRSRGEMDFLGDLSIAMDHALTLNAGAMVGTGGNVTVQAARLGFGNALGASAGNALPTTGGRFDVRAGEVDFGAGSTALRGFSTFSASAAQGIAGQGKGGMDFGAASVDLNAPVFLADSSAATSLVTTGAMRLAAAQGTALSRDAIGGGVSLKGGSVDVGMNVSARAGTIAVEATQGDAHVGAGSALDVSGLTKDFVDTRAYAPGGNLSIVADHGAVNIDQGTSLTFGGAAEGGDAGSLRVSGAGAVRLDGGIDGRAKDGYRGGYLTYASGGAVDLDGLVTKASSAGITGLLDVSSGAGDLTLSQGHALKSGKVYLYANAGTTRIDGTVDASGPVGGRIDLFGRDGVDIRGSLLAGSSIDEQRGGDVTIGTTGQGSTDQLDPTYGYELVQRANAGRIHVGPNAVIDVSGGSTAPIAGGRISFRAPLLADGDVPVQIDNPASLRGARDVTIEPYVVWSTADKSASAAKHFDGIVDPAGWYLRGADGKLVMVDGTWTDASGNILPAPAGDAQLKDYLTKNYFTPKQTNADHTGFFGYAGAGAASGAGTVMGFIQQPGFSFGSRYSPIANIHVRPGVELANPADGTGVDNGAIRIVTNWNLGAGTTKPDGSIALAYRYGAEAPVLTFRAGGDIDISASITDGFYQQNTGAVLTNPPDVVPPVNDNGYGDALLAYQQSQKYMDANDIWNNGTIRLKNGEPMDGGTPGGGTADISRDPNWSALQAPLKSQSASYYANYKSYIDEIGDGTNQKWAAHFNAVNGRSGFLIYSPNSSPFGADVPKVTDFTSYADYAAAYETWLESYFLNIPGFYDTTPPPLLAPVDTAYTAYSANYGKYIGGHSTYYNYVYNNVGNDLFGTQLFYAPFAPRSDSLVANPAYDKALVAYQASLKYLDDNGLWNNGTIRLKNGEPMDGGTPGGGTADISKDPNWAPLQAPLTGQSDTYYTNYGLYIDEVGTGSNNQWAAHFNAVNSRTGFLTYSPNNSPFGVDAPKVSDFTSYADYATAYETWLESYFLNIPTFYDTTPTPLLAPVDSNYVTYSGNYKTYIGGHSTYYNYVYSNVGNDLFGTQLFYAPFAPKANAAPSGNPAYDTALASYQTSLKYLDDNGIWNNGTIRLKNGEPMDGGTPGGGTADISKDPNWAPLQAPLTGQTDSYYTNYGLYIGEVGDGTNKAWAWHFNDVSARNGFLVYSPNSSPYGADVPKIGDFTSYADYASAYETWLESYFLNIPGFYDTTPPPLLAPVDTNYALYSGNYKTYIGGHSTYYNYIFNNVGNDLFGTQMFYAPFSPRANPAPPGGGDEPPPPPTTLPVPVAAANNGPSNMPSLGNPVPFASATLLGGASSSLRFVAGADLSSADPLAVRAGATGDVTLGGHFEVTDTYKGSGSGDPKSPFAGKTLVFPTTIRTGTGSIDVVTSGDIRWTDSLAPATIYTAGAPTAGSSAGTDVTVLRPSVTAPGAGNSVPDMLVSGLVNPDRAGDVSLRAGGDIDAIQEPVDTDGRVTKTKGSRIGQYWWQWMQAGNAADGSRTSINFANFGQGVMSVGGNVSVNAGGDISELFVSLPTTWYANATRDAVTTVGGGDLEVHAGGSILSGGYFVAKGRGRLVADGHIGPSADLANLSFSVDRQPVTTSLSTIIAMRDAQVSVGARTGVDLAGVFNPSYYKGSLLAALSPMKRVDNQSYGINSSIDVATTLGDVAFGSLKLPGTVFGGGGGGAGPVLPASVSMTALDGGIEVLTAGLLFPSATGNLTMLASGDIAFSKQTVGEDPMTTFGLGDRSVTGETALSGGAVVFPGTSDSGAGGALSHDITPLHGEDDAPVRIYSLNGDITDGISSPSGFNYLSMEVVPSKQAQIYAGRDIVNLAFVGQHTRAADVTRISAGRDIYDTAFNTKIPYGLYSPEGYTLPARLVLGGPGSFLVEAGRDIGPLTNQVEVSTSSTLARLQIGIQAIGNLYNPNLPHESADVNVNFGVGPGVDTAAFLSRYLDHPEAADGFASFNSELVDFMKRRLEGKVVDTGYAKDKVTVSLSVQDARTLLAQEPEYVQRLFAEQILFKVLAQVGKEYNDAGSPFAGKYARGYAAIDALFPASKGYTANGAGEGGLNGAEKPVSTGDLDIRSTTIQTQQGGNVTILGPGGQAIVGSTSAPSVITDSNGNVLAGPNTMGILTLEKGDINILTDRSVQLAQSRIFTEQGGDLVIWSSNGDINAGQGAKTTAEIPPPTYVCTFDAWCRIDARGQVSGAGIATLQTVEGAAPGSVYLVAPRGTVDAGDAGIRVSGDIVIAAARVANADNIQVKGESIGIPVVAAVNVGALNAASAAAGAATKAAEDVAKRQQSDARDKLPSVISVNVLRDGNNGASAVSPAQVNPVSVLGSGRLDSAQAGMLTPEERKHLR